MISDIPSHEDFEQTGLDSLNVAMDTALRLKEVIRLYTHGSDNHSDTPYDVSDSDEVNQYWSHSQRELKPTMSLVQQGAELLLKARLSKVSPFILVANVQRDWKSIQDKSFSELRSIDAVELIPAHKACVGSLTDEFQQEFSNRRDVRNVIMHTVDKALVINADDIIKYILLVVLNLVPEENWLTIRKRYLQKNPDNIHGHDENGRMACDQAAFLLRDLTAAECKKYLGIKKSSIKYLCPICSHGDIIGQDGALPTAEIKNNGSSDVIFCWACQSENPVTMKQCPGPTCNSKFIDSDGVCVDCGYTD